MSGETAPIIFGILAFLFGSGGLAAAVIAFYRAKPERESILAAANKSATEIFESSTRNLRDDLKWAREELQAARGEIARLEGELKTATADRDKLIEQIARLRERVAYLERRVGERPLKGGRRTYDPPADDEPEATLRTRRQGETE